MCRRKRISDAALDFFYHSFVYRLMSEGVSDMHCMSDEYLVEELIAECRKADTIREEIREGISDYSQ